MACTEVIEGRYVDLRSATIEDAEFTLAIRQAPEFSKWLPRIDNTIDQQRAWIERQREKAGDYFWVVWDKTGNRIGTISVYDVEGDCAETGRLAMRGNALQSLEAQLLSFQYAFYKIGLKKTVDYIYADNVRAMKLTLQFGGKTERMEERDGRSTYKMIIDKVAFENAEQTIKRFLYREEKGKEKK